MASLGTQAAGTVQGARPWGGAGSSAGSRCGRAGRVHQRDRAEPATGAEETRRGPRIQTAAGSLGRTHFRCVLGASGTGATSGTAQ